MALTDASKVAIALKKVQGKSQTKTENELYNEQFTSGLSLASKTIFAATPSNNPSTALNSVTDATVEKVRFVVEYITGTDTVAGRHAFKLKLPGDYVANSSNPNKSTGSYVNDSALVTSTGRLQVVPPQFGDAYIAKAYYGSIGSLTEIPLADSRDWVLDYFNGVFFQEDPPTDPTHNPTYVEAYLYIGEYLDQRLQAHEASSSELATGFDKYVKRVTATTAALTNVTFTGLNTTDVPNDASLRVFLNGDLLLEGNQTTTTAYSNADPRIPSATNTHYYISGTSTLQFGFALQDGDYVVVEKHSFMGNLNPRHGLVVDSSGSEYIIDVEYSGATTSVIRSATDGTSITVDEANDFLLLHDVTDNVVKYIKPNQLPSGDITGVTAGTGLTGGGSTGAITLNVEDLTLNEIADGSLTTSGESFADNDNTLMTSAAINDLIESKGYTTQTGDVTSVVAGTGLATGGTSGDVTVDIDYAGADSVIKSATDGTGITVDEENDFLLVHDATDNTVKYVKAGQVGSTSGGTIGAAEDGDYTDGLFSSFTTSTPTGTAIDKFNEILKLLAPGPAHDVKSINTTTSNGISAKLSFGATNTGGSTYINSGNGAGMTPIDTNSVYGPTTQGTSERLGIFLNDTTIEGVINHDVSIDQYANSVVNYVADSFGNGELGTLKLFVNNMSTPVHSVDLASFTGAGNPGSGSGTSFTSNSGFFAVSTTKDATSEGGTAFNIFKHRTAKYRIHPNHQREGWNYARIVHTLSAGDKTTNYIEWINDTDTTSITATSTSVGNIVGSDQFVLSGIKYFKTASFDYNTTVNNAHRGIHTATPIAFNSQYGSITAATDQNSVNLITTFPGVATGQDFTKPITITSSGTFNVGSSGFPASGLLNQGSTLSINVVHPRTSKNQTGLAATSVPNLLMWYPSSTSNAVSEDFNSEAWRIQSGAYNTQAAVYTSGAFVAPWNSATAVNSADAGHNTGLVQYQGQLRAPRNTLLNGNFASVTNGPSSNVNYSTITSGTREYIRAFKKTSAGTVRDLRLGLTGSASIIANGATFGTNKIKVFVKLPGTTGWMDLAGTFALGSNGDNDGAHVSTYTPTISGLVNNYVSFGLDTIAQNEYVLVKILADASWTGNLSAINVQFGASSGAETSVPDSCSSISTTTSNGVSGKVSFGATQSIPGSDANQPYSNIAGVNSLATADINTAYTPGSNRKGIYNGSQVFVGVVNSGESGDSQNFAANSIRYGNEGTMNLYVNDVLVHSIDLTDSSVGAGVPGSGTQDSFESTHNASGFTDISQPAYATWSDGIPDFRYNVRTMSWKVGTQHQRSGHNWVRVVHAGATGSPHNTTYIEWVNDPNNNALAVSGITLENFTDSDISQLSGIKYFNSPSTTMKFRVENGYRNIYSSLSQAIGFASLTHMDLTNLEITGAGVTDPNDVSGDKTLMPPIITSSNTAYTLPLDVTGSFNYTVSTNLPGTHGTSQSNPSATPFIVHPIKNVSPSAASKTGMLVWTPTQSGSSNNHTIEDFSAESYRLEDQAFPANTSTTTTVDGATWDSTQSLVGADAQHNTGLCIYNGKVLPPSKAGNSGDFVTNLQGPSGNVDYSGATTGGTTRTYLRKFHKTDIGDAATSISLRLTGTGKLVSQGGNKAFPKNQETLTNDSANFYIKVKFIYHSTQSPATKNTGWLDAGEASNLGAADGSACQSADDNKAALNKQWNNSTNTVVIRIPTNRELLGSDSANSNYVIIKIEASENWTGHFSDMRITSMT